jgi:hypothetical protein
MTNLTYEQFVKQYKPIRNPAAGEDEAFNGCVFDTDYGRKASEQIYSSFPQRQIFTLTESDSSDRDKDFIQSGYHFVNRLGYFITEVPYAQGEQITVSTD